MPKYFFDKESDKKLSEETIHHLKRVLRVRVGDKVVLCDGKSTDYHTIIKNLTPFEYEIENTKESGTELSTKITLYQAMPKADKMEWIVQKAVELGVYAIVPVYTEHCVKRNTKADAKANVKIERLQKIAESAAGQSMRGIVPSVVMPMEWDKALKNVKEKEKMLNIVAYEKERDTTIKSVIDKNEVEEISLWIGPEGGFSKKEVQDMEDASFELVSLGSRILRTETAAIAAITLMADLVGDSK